MTGPQPWRSQHRGWKVAHAQVFKSMDQELQGDLDAARSTSHTLGAPDWVQVRGAF